jgi:BASS family bile acid:Na+ symporter
MPELRTIVTVLSAAYLVSMMFALGLEVGGGPKESKEKKRARRRLLIRGLLVELVLLPLAAFAVVRALHASGDLAIALLILAAVPGGRFAPHLVKLGGGSMALAIEVTLFLAKLTGFTSAPTAKLMLTLHSVEVRELPFIAQLILLQFVPLYAGKWVRKRYKPMAERLRGPTQVVAIALAIAAFAVVLVKGTPGFRELLHGPSWIAVALVLVGWPLLGWLTGGPDLADRKNFAITANCRELALALMIASFAFPERGVHIAIFGLWSLMALASFLLASGMRAYGGLAPRITAAGGRAPAMPAAARSGQAR